MYENNIFWLDIPMNDIILMQVFASLEQRLANERNSFLLKNFSFLEGIIQLSIRAKLHKKIDIKFITKDGVDLNYVGVR